MALDVFFYTDIRNALLAAEQAGDMALQAAGGGMTEYTKGYQIGYHAALTTIALAFGLLEQVDSSGPELSRARDRDVVDWQEHIQSRSFSCHV